VARLLSDVFQPVLLGSCVLLVVAVTTSESFWHGLAWGMGTVLLTAGVPTLDILRRMRRSTVDDFHIFAREQRLRPLLVALASTVVAFSITVLFDASLSLQACLLSALVTGVVLTVITGRWKISFHAATAASSSVLLVWVLGPAALLLAPLAPAIAWSRVRLQRHTPTQALAGLLVGLVMTLLVLSLY
jgi:membrane-associated phospholipid phosphatase